MRRGLFAGVAETDERYVGCGAAQRGRVGCEQTHEQIRTREQHWRQKWRGAQVIIAGLQQKGYGGIGEMDGNKMFLTFILLFHSTLDGLQLVTPTSMLGKLLGECAC